MVKNPNNPFLQLKANGADSQKSVQWYQAQVRKLGNINVNRLIREGNQVTRIFPGEMYLFRYDPKLKEQLQYFDIYPLVLPFRRLENGFLGINLHYLPYGIRKFTLEQLSTFVIDKRMNDDTRIRLSWRLLESSVKFEPAKACVKHYLIDQVQTRFLKIPFPDWTIATQLPVERFIGAQKFTVWRDTRRKYRNVQSVF
jgi:hypothetical protein